MSSGPATVGQPHPAAVSPPEHPQEDVLAQLLSCYLFQDLTPAELLPLARHARTSQYQQGEAVYVQGDPATAIYIVTRGQLREVLTTAQGREMTTELLRAGDVFGEPGIFARERDRIVSVVAVQDSHLLQVNRRDLLPFLFAHPPAMHRLLEALVAVVREEVEHAALAHFASVQDRLAIKLAELAELQGTPHQHGTAINIELPQSLLASLVAATRPNVNQALGELVTQGHIVRDGRTLVVRDPAALRESLLASRRLIHRRNKRP